MFTLKKTNAESEFDTHSHIFQQLKTRGLHVRGEVRGFNGDGTAIRLDIVVFDDAACKNPVWAIEVKPRRRDRWKAMYATHPQMRAYSRLGMPVFVVCGMAEAEAFLERKDLADVPPSVHWCPWHQKATP